MNTGRPSKGLKQIPLKVAHEDWRGIAKSEFNLKPVPSTWSERARAEKARGTQDQWRLYGETRRKLEAERKDKELKASDQPDEEDLIAWASAQDIVQKTLKSTLGLAEEDFVAWEKSLYFTVEDMCSEDGYEYRSFVIVATLFSPWLIPKAVDMSIEYCRRVQQSHFSFNCWFRMMGFRSNGKRLPNGKVLLEGDKIHVSALRRCKRQAHRRWRELLCRNYWESVPDDDDSLYGEDDSSYDHVEEVINVNNFVPGTVCRIREWLLNDAIASQAQISNYALMALLLAPTKLQGLDIGHSCDVAKAMIRHGFPKSNGRGGTIVSWFDHQLHLATESLRPVDRFYTPNSTKAT